MSCLGDSWDRPDALYFLWQTSRFTPRMDRVAAALKLLLYSAILHHSKTLDSSGGPHGNQFRNVQNRFKNLIAEVYDNCLAKIL